MRIRKNPLGTAILLTSIIAWFVACTKSNDGAGPTPMQLRVPANFPPLVYDTALNPLTQEGFELGRKLFYDPILSRNNTISCGSCHIQGSGFTHHGHDVSHGIDDQLGTRNSLPVVNLAWYRQFFWDGGVFHLDLLPLAPIENPVEMDESPAAVVEKIRNSSQYTTLFRRAFGDPEITSTRMLKALSQFMVHCMSANSRYDSFVRNEGVKLTQDEQEGLLIFQQKCASCHTTDLFTDQQFHNIGLLPSLIDDKGRALITLNDEDNYKFKTPSLRNVVQTAPYMHDGRFRTLMAVLDHYSDGVQDMPTLDRRLRNGNRTGIPLTAPEKNKIIAFLRTLTDDSFLRDPKLAEQ
ncbi:MAG TPA: cytochrome c peroxidase [Lacibacter sp.]|nr:cytochrome c peroxidase [Lacibacter sp.]HMO89900.1 cytochrome c peroxidase [Lacibacter sp.]HMP85993.1 cytochrome c peroxidase [Lacibacter sp.]